MFLQNKLYLLLPLLTLISAPANADYLQDKCNQLYKQNPPQVSITYNYGQLKYDNSKSTEELNDIFNKINPDSNAKNVHGLTDMSPHLTTMTEVKQIQIEDGATCFLPNHLEIKMWYEPTVYISKSLQNGTCRYNITVRHELTHLDLGHYALYVFAKSLKKSVPHILSSVQPQVQKSYSADPNTIVNQITDAYQQKVMVQFKKFKELLEKYNHIIDTEDNYIKEGKLCPNG